jgi:hypothetical protein
MAALTLRAYGRHRRAEGLPGGSLQAVQKALKRGWIHALPSGRIDPVAADREWAGLTVERVSVYRPGTRQLKRYGDRPAAKCSTWRRAAGLPLEKGPSSRAGPWKPSAAQVRRWMKCRAQLVWIGCRLAGATLSPHVPKVRPRERFWLYQLEHPDWAYQEPRVYALEMACDLVSAALIELSRAIGYRGYTCPEER